MGDAGTWVGVGLTALALAIAYLTYRSQRDRKRIEYVVTADTELLPDSVVEEFEVTHSGRPVPHPALTIVRIVNTGDRAIEPTDYETNLKVTLEGVSQIVSASFTAVRPVDLKPEIEFTSDTAGITPILINPEDMLQLQLLSEGKPTNVGVSGRVAELEIVRRKYLPYPPGSGDEGEMLPFDRFVWWVLGPLLILSAGVAFGPLSDERSPEAQIAIMGAAVVIAFVVYPIRIRYLVRRRRMWAGGDTW